MLRYEEHMVGWEFPLHQWMKGNADGFVGRELGGAACGGIFSDRFLRSMTSKYKTFSLTKAGEWGPHHKYHPSTRHVI